MGKTNAEHQAAYRGRQASRLAELERAVAELRGRVEGLEGRGVIAPPAEGSSAGFGDWDAA